MRSQVLSLLVPACLTLLACSSDGTPSASPPQQGTEASAEAESEAAADAGPDTRDDAEPVDLDAEAGACIVDAYYHPVCGEDGKTYDNAEVATECAKVAIAHDGPCEEDAGPDVDPSCSVDAYANLVCGADGTTYSNPEEAECHQVAVAHYGACTVEEDGKSLQDPGCPSAEPSGTCTLSDTSRCYYWQQGWYVPDLACSCVQGDWACEAVVPPDAG